MANPNTKNYDRYAEAIRLRRQGLSYKTIGDRMNLSVSRVGQLIRNGERWLSSPEGFNIRTQIEKRL